MARYRVPVPILVLKLLLAPVLIAVASLATRRWGPRVGGWLISLPLNSTPVLVVLALEQGGAFAASAALGAMSGMAANAAFAGAYVYAGRGGIAQGMLVATPVFLLAGGVLQPLLGAASWLVAAAMMGAISAGLLLLPPRTIARRGTRHPRWDIPARMLAATGLVFALTTVAPLLGPQLTGLLATYPVYASVMTAFTHRIAGLPAATELLGGYLTGLYGTVAFFLVMNVGLVPLGLIPALLLAIGAALVTQAVAFRVSPGRRSASAAKPAEAG